MARWPFSPPWPVLPILTVGKASPKEPASTEDWLFAGVAVRSCSATVDATTAGTDLLSKLMNMTAPFLVDVHVQSCCDAAAKKTEFYNPG
jgi:hypothetical protein